MKVKELIEALQALPAEQHELEVISEGCDCYGAVAKLEVEETCHPVDYSSRGLFVVLCR